MHHVLGLLRLPRNQISFYESLKRIQQEISLFTRVFIKLLNHQPLEHQPTGQRAILHGGVGILSDTLGLLSCWGLTVAPNHKRRFVGLGVNTLNGEDSRVPRQTGELAPLLFTVSYSYGCVEEGLTTPGGLDIPPVDFVVRIGGIVHDHIDISMACFSIPLGGILHGKVFKPRAKKGFIVDVLERCMTW